MVHPCDKPCGNKTASGYCATTACINPQYSNFGTAQYQQNVQKCIVTNADRIRAMSDEELALYLSENANGDCPTFGDCPDGMQEKTVCTPSECWLSWLKSPADLEVGK